MFIVLIRERQQMTCSYKNQTIRTFVQIKSHFSEKLKQNFQTYANTKVKTMNHFFMCKKTKCHILFK